jgi:hypothetical protein
MDHISSHMAKPDYKKERVTERGELMKYFQGELNRARIRDSIPPLTMPRMGKILEAIPTKDLYYLKSVCEKSRDFSKKFWWEIKPRQKS